MYRVNKINLMVRIDLNNSAIIYIYISMGSGDRLPSTEPLVRLPNYPLKKTCTYVCIKIKREQSFLLTIIF